MNRESMTVLVVEENSEDFGLLRDALDSLDLWSITVHRAADYDVGLERMASIRPDVCLLAHRLGTRTGVEFLREPSVRSDATPVIMMTGAGGPEIDREARAAGAVDCLPRHEFTRASMERALRYAQERRRRRAAEARLEALAGVGREVLALVDSEGVVAYVSGTVSRVVGLDPADVVGTPAMDHVQPGYESAFADAITRIREDPGRRERVRVGHARGTEPVYDVMLENRLHDPLVRGIVLSAWDVSELLEQRERVRFQADLLEAVGQAVIATDLDGTVTYWNRAAEEFYGWSAEEAVGTDILKLTPTEEDRERAVEVMETLRRGESWSGEFRVRRKDGTTIPALITNSVIHDEQQRPIGIVGISSDISEIKTAEFHLRERVKELATLGRVATALNRPGVELRDRLEQCVEILPGGWLDPEVTEARIRLGDTTVSTAGFRETPWMREEEIALEGRTLGSVEVALTRERESDGGPLFLAEEDELLRTVARSLAEAAERHRVTSHLARTVESLEEAVIIVDGAGTERTIESVNSAAVKIFGYPAEEMIGRSPAMLHPDQEAFDRFTEAAGSTIRSQGVYHGEWPMRRGDGTPFPAEETVTPLNPDEGLDAGFVKVVRDVSVRRKVQEELERSEQRFRQIAEHIEDVFWIGTPRKDRLEYVSPAYRRVWGRDPVELYRDPSAWLRHIHPADRARARRFNLLQQVGDRGIEYRIVRPSGEIRWIHDRAFAVRDAEGQVQRIIGVAGDITERKEAEERLGLITREIDEVIYLLAPDGTVRFSTPSVEQATGYSRDEFEGMNAMELVHPDDRAGVLGVLEDVALAPDRSARVEYRFLDRDGGVRHVESSARNLMDRPGIEGILVATRDITERKKLERALQQSQRLEAVGRLAGGIAHDFNNLLTIIRSQTSLVLMDVGEDAGLVEDLGVIHQAADRAASLTRQLLAFSREQVLQPQPVDLCAVVARMGSLVERVIGDDIQLEVDLPNDLPTVEIDPGQLEQAVLNLAINARDAMPRGGTLRLATARVRIDELRAGDELRPGDHVELVVTDTGIGMDAATRSRVFEPFFTTKGESGGTGLGLSTIYGFVRQSGGTVELESVPGEGSTFRLIFPTVDKRAVELRDFPDASANEEVGDRGRILLVEDEAAVRKVAVRILERAGFTVDPFPTAEDAIATLEQGAEYDLLLTDLGLPGLGGRELLEWCLQERPELAVAAMSGYAPDSPGGSGKLPPSVPFLPKPFTTDGLVRKVREVMSEGR